MAIQINNAMTLKDLAASVVIKNDLVATQDQRQANELRRILVVNWEKLKAISTKMQVETSHVEERVLCKYQGPNEPEAQVLKKNINRLFKKLAKECGGSTIFRNTVPISVSAYEQLQQAWENEALVVLWKQIPTVPPLEDPDEIRDWLKMDSNAAILTKITHLDLSFPTTKKQIRIVPSEIRFCTELQELSLDDNLISFIPALCTKLKKLNANGNRILFIPSEIGLCIKLQELSLNENRISLIPPEIGLCTKLRRLYLDHNFISSIPSEIGSCIRLSKLSLLSNPIRSLPPELENCKELEEPCLDRGLLSSFTIEPDRNNDEICTIS
jgi:Leucine-rich repeat (LRR) protein